MVTRLLRRLGWRRRAATRDPANAPRGAGWDRLYDDPTFDYTRRLAESPGGQPPRVRWRGRG